MRSRSRSGPVSRQRLVAAAGMAAIVGWPVLTGGSAVSAGSAGSAVSAGSAGSAVLAGSAGGDQVSGGRSYWPAIVGPSMASGTGTQLLDGVAAVSASNVWAVGTLIEHWNGRKWSVQAGPKTRNCHPVLLGVSVVSASRIWAVGRCYNARGQKAIIEQWDGRHWALQASPRAGTGGNSALLAVKAISASSVWAVGEAAAGTSVRTLIEHWNGRQWKIIPSLGPGPHGTVLDGVTAVSARSAWAVGYSQSTQTATGPNLIEHWNGHAWKVQPCFNPGNQANVLFGVTSVSGSDVWAAGAYVFSTAPNTLVENWNGQSWLVQSTEDPAPHDFLLGIAARSPSDAWAVGVQNPSPALTTTLVLRWDGTSWAITPSPNRAVPMSVLEAVATISGSSAWAVGYSGNLAVDRTLIEHWDGHSWKVQASPN